MQFDDVDDFFALNIFKSWNILLRIGLTAMDNEAELIEWIVIVEI